MESVNNAETFSEIFNKLKINFKENLNKNSTFNNKILPNLLNNTNIAE